MEVLSAGEIALSKLLAKVLRHEPELVGIQPDAQGWVQIEMLLSAIERSTGRTGAHKRLQHLPVLTREILEKVVRLNDKRRFALSDDGLRVRAVQGHSIGVELGHPTLPPPSVLFHGTAARSWPSIKQEGLTPRSRHAVHLSVDASTARRVGARHGRAVVLEIAARLMHEDGHQFALADNGVWLIASVPPAYIKVHSRDL